ncbi:MAG: hypothetical protein V1685_03765, partial [Parcubacteria group bacterium]
ANIILIFILVLITPAFLLVTSLKTHVLTTTFLKAELERNDAYELVFEAVDEQIDKMELGADEGEQLPITTEDISGLVHQVFTPAWLQENVEHTLDGIDAWLKAPAGTDPQVVVSLAEPKESLRTSVDALLTDKLATIEPCDPNIPEEERGLCNFAGTTLEQAKEELARDGINFDELITKLPDTFDLANPDLSQLIPTIGQTGEGEEPAEGQVDEGSETEPQELDLQVDQIKDTMEQVKSYYQLADRMFWYAWILYGVLFALFIVMNATGGWRRAVRWTGTLFLCVGFLPLLIGLGSSYAVESAAIPNLHFSPDYPPAVADAIPDIVRSARAAVFTLPLTVGAVLFVLGLAGIIGGHWIPKAGGSRGLQKAKELLEGKK